MNFLKLTMIDTPSPRDADASKNYTNELASHVAFKQNQFQLSEFKLDSIRQNSKN